ncbi:MAG: hypothetical protein VW991_05185 [Aquiluna sp.]|jgi:hypothetical protein
MRSRASGIGRLLIAVYGVFAISATARASFQLLTKFDEAPVAYSLSALSAFVYILATIALAKSGERWNKLAWLAIGFELAGVLMVGAASILLPELFAHPSVWSGFGIGYGLVPLFLPILGLIWLRRTNASD